MSDPVLTQNLPAPVERASRFQEAAIAGADAPGKQEARERVREHLLRHRTPDRRLRCFTMPSARWRFEEGMLDASPEARFVCVERNVRVWERSRLWMPGRGRFCASEELGRCTFVFAESDRARLALTELSALVRFRARSHRGNASNKKVKAFAQRWCANTCAWFDFTGQLCDDILACLSRAATVLDPGLLVVPVAITVMGARERGNANNAMRLLDNRGRVIDEYLSGNNFRTFVRDDSFEYVGAPGAPMLTVLGRAVLRSTVSCYREWRGAS